LNHANHNVGIGGNGSLTVAAGDFGNVQKTFFLLHNAFLAVLFNHWFGDAFDFFLALSGRRGGFVGVGHTVVVGFALFALGTNFFMVANRTAAAIFAHRPYFFMFANGTPAAIFALRPNSFVWADATTFAILALVSLSIVFTNALALAFFTSVPTPTVFTNVGTFFGQALLFGGEGVPGSTGRCCTGKGRIVVAVAPSSTRHDGLGWGGRWGQGRS